MSQNSKDATEASMHQVFDHEAVPVSLYPIPREEALWSDQYLSLERLHSLLESLKASTPETASSIWDDKFAETVEQVDRCQEQLLDLLTSAAPVARPRSEWHENDGDVLWWHFPIEGAPYCGRVHDADWPEDLEVVPEGYYTHWTRVAVPVLPGKSATDLA